LKGFSKEADDFYKQVGTQFLFFPKRQPKIEEPSAVIQKVLI
jgi:hypothetical protein